MPESNQPIIEDTTPGKQWQNRSIKNLLKRAQKFLYELVDIKKGMDQRGTIKNIHNNKEMKGANAWLLMCSIMVASLGLDLNSPAVIIGAMLISPLMSPILGIGLGVGINDRKTLFISLQHFGLAIIIALATSFLYFKITPFGTLTDEISARTAPNLLDGLVAIFGGFAGIISITRKDKSNAIPGVAIATALMPPLCVAGFGLAKGEWQFFANAFYLFFLNSFFIALSTHIVVRILGFKYKEYINKKEANRNRLAIFVFAILILIPAINLLMDAYEKLQERTNIENFITHKFQTSETVISNWEYHPNDSISQLDIQLIGDPVSDYLIMECDNELEKILGKPIKITTYQSEEIPFEDIQKLKTEIGGIQGEFANKLEKLEKLQQEKEQKINQLNQEIDSLKTGGNLTNIYTESKALFPLIEEIGLAQNVKKTNFSSEIEIPILFLKWNRRKPVNARIRDQQKLKNFIQIRTNLDTLIVVAY